MAARIQINALHPFPFSSLAAMLPLRLLPFLSAMLTPVIVAAAPIAWQGEAEIAAGRGEKGPWQQNESRYDYVDDPAVVVDGRGHVAVAWVDQARKDVFFQRLSPDGSRHPATPVNLSRNPDSFSWLPRMARAPGSPSGIYVLWQEIIFSGGSHGGDILFARSDDDGATFSQPINLSSSRGGDGKGTINEKVWHNGSFDLAAGPDDAVYATWTEFEGTLWFSRSTDGGKSFSPPQRIAGGEGSRPVRAPSLALGPDRVIHLAWTTGEDDGADIHVASSVDGGTSFGQPQVVAPSDCYADAPKMAVTPDGKLHLVYAQSDGGPFGRFHIRYTRSPDGGRTFEPPRAIMRALPDAAESVHYPSLSTDGGGRLYVLYELYRDHRKHPRGLGLTVSSNGGRDFSAPSVVPASVGPAGGTNGSHQGRLMKKLAVSGDGSVAIVNSSLVEGKQSVVWLIRGTAQHVVAQR